MTTFLQLHLLTSYPPSNLNRDDLGRPKQAVMGGVHRLRVSSQALKRAWRTSPLFTEALGGHRGTRTKSLGTKVVFQGLLERGVPEALAREAAEGIAGTFGKLKAVKKGEVRQDFSIEQLAHFSPEELVAVDALIETVAAEKRVPTEDEIHGLLREQSRAVDIALFGRMMAAKPNFNVEAAAQVAHALTVHQAETEDDYFSAVDDLNEGDEDRGAGHIGEAEFGAGLFYLYLCIDRDLLVENLSGDEGLAQATLRTLTEAAATVAPGGKQNSFASRAYASYILAEKGSRQPRSLSVAFLKPVEGRTYLESAVRALREMRERVDGAYWGGSEASAELSVLEEGKTLPSLLDFVAAPLAE